MKMTMLRDRYSGKVDLLPVTNEISFFSNDGDQNAVLEVELLLGGYASWRVDGRNFVLNECNDVRIYHGSSDITKKFILNLANQFKSNGLLLAKYHEGLDSLLDKEKNNGYSSDYVKEYLIKEYKEIDLEKGMSALFLRYPKQPHHEKDNPYQLGNGTPYHVFNFFSRYVDLKPVKISEISGGDLNSDCLTICAGPDPILNKDFKNSDYGIGGVMYTVSVFRKNPLEDRVIQLENDLEVLASTLYDRLKSLSGQANRIEIQNKNVTSEFTKLNSELQANNANVQVLSDQIKNLK